MIAPSAATARASSRGAIAVALAALILGIAGDGFLHGPEIGLNLPLWIAGIAAWTTYLSRSHSFGRTAPDYWQLPAVLFAAAFAFRTNEALLVFDFMAMLAALSLPLLRSRGFALWRAQFSDYLSAGIALAFNLATGGLRLLAAVPWGELMGTGRARRIGRVAAGGALALVVVTVFGALFASADPLFNEIAALPFGLDFGEAISHVVVALILAGLAGGYLRGRLWAGGRQWSLPVLPPPRADFVIVGMGLGAMVATFTLFVAIQARYLFGGVAFLQQATGLTLAEYARGGFFQCVAACAIALPSLLLCDWMIDPKDARAVRSFRALAGVQLLLVGAVGLSALSRMRLYALNFGLSEERIFAVAFLLWLVGVSAWFALTVLRGARWRFAWGAVAGGFATLGGLNVANPDAMIARYNMTHVAPGRALDVKYLMGLKADAAPEIIEHLDAIPESERCAVLETLNKRWGAEDADWRSWNLSRYRARRAVNGNGPRDCSRGPSNQQGRP